MIGISSCLTGKKCRYDGSARPNEACVALAASGQAVCLCPECLAGLPIPRVPSEIVGGTGADVLDGRARVMGADGSDRTQEFLRGAAAALALAKEKGVTRVMLKSKSPSCGAGQIYDGSFSGRLISGNGVTAELFRRSGIQIICID